MKKILLCIVVIASLFCLFACGDVGTEEITVQNPTVQPKPKCDEHHFEYVDCKKPVVCSVCGTKGALARHSFEGGDCVTAATCIKCGEIGDAPAGHKFVGGDCQTEKLCSACGATGELGSHEYSGRDCTTSGVCAICGAEQEPLGHAMKEATCTEPSTCIRCGYSEGDALGHEGQGFCVRCRIEMPIKGSGKGDAVVKDITILESGIYVLHMTHSGRRNFIVHSFDAYGDEELLINTIGKYDGTVWLLGESPLMFNIEADGKWEYEIKRLEKTDDTHFSGSGDFVTNIFSTRSGAQVWHFSYSGDGNFIVRLFTTDGLDYIINEIGDYDADQIITIPAGSNAFFIIKADGEWEIYPA